MRIYKVGVVFKRRNEIRRLSSRSSRMDFPTHISHYFEKEVGPLMSICELEPQERNQIIDREKTAQTGFNRFAFGEEFFDFRLRADDLLLELYERKFGQRPERRPFYGVLGNADVVGGLYRDPYKLRISIDEFGPGELTFMCPDHFHLVSWMERGEGTRMFGVQLPKDYTESEYPYFGKLMTYKELVDGFVELKVDQHLERERKNNGWYRYIEAQIWSEPDRILRDHGTPYEVTPEPWTHNGVTYLQNYKSMQAEQTCDD